MTAELLPLFEPISARFDEQSLTIARLRAELDQLHSQPQPAPAPPPPAPPAPPPPAPSSDDTGWTPIPPIDTASGARVVYVSSSSGKNTNTGLSPDAPFETLAKAITLLRDNAGDRLLLRCGDTFAESLGNWTKSGRSPDQPLLISSFGEGARPRVVAPGSVFNLYTAPVHDLAIVGLHLTAARRDPAAPDFDPTATAGHGIRLVKPVTNLLVEDCRIEFFLTNLTLTAGDSPGAKLANVTVRRCQVLDAYATTGAFSGQGLYASGCDGLLIEDNVFDHNGWNTSVPGAAPNIFRHNLYLSAANTNVAVRGNVIANAASHGLQLRGGGVIEDNLFQGNALHCLLCGATGLFRRNVVIGGRDIDASNPRGFGLTLACGDGRAQGNLFAHKPTTVGPALHVERNDWTPAGPTHAAFVANTVYAWSGSGLEVAGDCDLVEFAGNDLQRGLPDRKVITVRANVKRFQLAANRYDSAEPMPDHWFSLNGGFVIPARWSTETGDTSRVERVEYREPPPNLPDGFLSTARAQSRRTWNSAATARAVCRQLLEAFAA